MDNGDKSWMGLRRSTDEYIRGVNDFLNKAFERASQGNEILCPYKKCANCYWRIRNVVEDHLVGYGFIQGYTKWIFHGEKISSRTNPHPSNGDEGSNMHDDIYGLLHDTFRNVEGDMRHEEGVREGPSEDAKRFFKLVEEGKQELYPGLNEHNQPVGPSEDVVIELDSFLGTLARNANLCPLDIYDWRKMDTKDDLWTYTKEKYDIPDTAKKWVLDAIQAAWRRHKSNLKKQHFEAYGNDEIRMQNRPEYIPTSQFEDLLKYWNSEKVQKMSEINIENRKNLKNPHTAGKTSFAVVRNDLEKEKNTSEPLSLREFFVATRARKPGRSYKAEKEKIGTQQSEDASSSVNAFAAVMGPEHPGRLRLQGRGVRRTSMN